MRLYTVLLYFLQTALHVADHTLIHHQEHIQNVFTTSGTGRTEFATVRWRGGAGIIFLESSYWGGGFATRCWIKAKFQCRSSNDWVCSTFKILHDLSSDRCEPGWSLSIINAYTLVRDDWVFGIILVFIWFSLIWLLFWQLVHWI